TDRELIEPRSDLADEHQARSRRLRSPMKSLRVQWIQDLLKAVLPTGIESQRGTFEAGRLVVNRASGFRHSRPTTHVSFQKPFVAGQIKVRKGAPNVLSKPEKYANALGPS